MATLHGIRFGVGARERYNESTQTIEIEHSATYFVEADNEDDRELEISLTSGLPKIGSASIVYPGAYCMSRDIREVGPKSWEVECLFSTVSRSTEEPDDRKPWDRTPTWTWSTDNVEEPLLYDADDNTVAIANSALEPLPPVGVPVAVPVLTIKRTKLTFSPDEILNYCNTRNELSFWGAGAGKAWLADIQASPVVIEDVKAWEVTYVIRFKMDDYGWKLRLLDQGTYYWTGTVASSQKKPFGDDAFQQVVGNLNGSGGKNTTTTPEFVEYNRFREADWTDLDLGPWNE